MERLVNVLVQLIRYEIAMPGIDDSCLDSVSEELLIELFTMAKKHGLAALVGHALQEQHLLERNQADALFSQEILNTIYHYEKKKYVYQIVCETLEKGQISYIPLKGVRLWHYYPEPWMRTSCDIDILVRKEEIHVAENLLTSVLGFVKSSESAYDTSLFSPDGIHIEFHHSLMEHGRARWSSQVLDQVWEYASPVRSGSYEYKMEDAMLYFYHIAHMAKHFESGGCGIKLFLDLWFMMEHINQRSRIDEFLKNSGLVAFENAMCQLCQVWFSGKEHDRDTLKLEKFVLDSGAYGTREHLYLANQRKYRGKFRYLFSRIFLPYEKLKYRYPSVKRWPILTPIFAIFRLLQFLFGRKRTFMREYLGVLKNDLVDKAESIDNILDFVGL